VAKRMNKKQQMRWNRATVQPIRDVRAAVLNDTLEEAFRRRYPSFRPANDDQAAAAVSYKPYRFACALRDLPDSPFRPRQAAEATATGSPTEQTPSFSTSR
jgi:hypothetical protein